MARRHLLVERPPVPGRPVPVRVQVQVDDRAAIGPWIATLAARLGYPLVDAFGAPLTYRLRLVPGNLLLPTTGRFAQARFPSGSLAVLEPEPRPRPAPRKNRGCGRGSLAGIRVSRRALLGVLTSSSVLGFGSGVATVLAQHALTRPAEAAALSLTEASRFARHQQTVRALAWSPDGGMLASGDDEGVIWVWKRDGTGLCRRACAAPVAALAWSPDGRQLVAGVGNAVLFFDAPAGELLAEQDSQHRAAVTALGWTTGPASSVVSASKDRTAVVWSGRSYQPVRVFRGHTAAIEALTVEEKMVVTVSAGGLARVWSAATAEELHGYYARSPQPLRAAASTRQGTLAMGGDDGVIWLWEDARTCQRQRPERFGVQCLDAPIALQGHQKAVRALASAPDGTLLASGGADQRLLLWSMQTSKPLLIQRQPQALLALAWSPAGSLLAGALGGQVLLWHLDR